MSIVKQCVMVLLLSAVAATASAEMAEINVAQQYGVSFLPLMLMERDKLVEKHAKAAMMAITKALAKELAQNGVTVNTVAPGIIDTEFHDRHTAPHLRDEWIKTLIPMQRAGQPHEVAKVVAFVASDDASYMTGSTLDVNGGMAMY